MKTFKVHGQSIQAKTFFEAYAKRFNVTVTQSIADRDGPMTKEQCIEEFFLATKRLPDQDEIVAMHPESEECVRQFCLETYDRHF